MDSLTRLKRLVVQHFTYDALTQVDKSLLGSCAPNQRGISPNEIQHYELWWLGSPLFYHYIELEPYDITAVEGYDLFLQELKETSDFPLCALLKNIEPLDIISNCSSFTKFQRVIAWCAEATLANIRNSFWIPSARNVVRKILRTCITCRKVSAKGSHQLMVYLPAARLTACRVFSQVVVIEAVLNSPAICPLSNDPNDVETLTPAHFLVGSSLVAVPDPDYTEIPMNRLSRWQLIQRLNRHFWGKWSTEYLNRLQQRPKWCKGNVDFKKGTWY
ncbi:uncharacterized protein TNCV_1555221 [Trichonephila clavipes]|nr:uncharacterized protein TNCV_1555221 [Trichonephila clavipes]